MPATGLPRIVAIVSIPLTCLLSILYCFSILNNIVNYSNIITALKLNLIYFTSAVVVFYIAFYGARKKGTLVNIGE